jgi:hypothetical protein
MSDDAKLEQELAARVDGEVRFDKGTKAAYAQDASNYRQVPIGVVLPKTAGAAVEAIAVCRELGVPVLSRRSGMPTLARPSSPTGFPAARRSRQATSAGRVCT